MMTRERAVSEEQPTAIEQAPDREITLQSLALHLPDKPMLINGHPFSFTVDEDRLAGSINYMRAHSKRLGEYEPQALVISLGESLPPKISGENGTEQPVHDYANNQLLITVPSEIIKSDVPADTLARLVEASMNEDLERGIHENKLFKRTLSRSSLIARTGSLACAGAGGTAWVVTSPENIVTIAERATIGTLGGFIAGLFVVGFSINLNYKRFGGEAAKLAHIARLRAKKESPNEEEQSYFDKPIISLVPVGDGERLRPVD